VGAGEDRLGAAQGGDETAGDGLSRFSFISTSYFSIYLIKNDLQDGFLISFSLHFLNFISGNPNDSV
jgi:hypothetical protein